MKEDHDFIVELDQVTDVDKNPEEPGEETAETPPPEIGDGRVPADDRKIPFVMIVKRPEGNILQTVIQRLNNKLPFYPKDDTPGCTIECKEFRDAAPKFEGKAMVFGISADDRASHEAFRDKFSLSFPLLCDVGHKVCDAYGIWGSTKWGEGISRTTVIVGTDGRIKKVFENVTPQGHAEEVLAAL